MASALPTGELSMYPILWPPSMPMVSPGDAAGVVEDHDDALAPDVAGGGDGESRQGLRLDAGDDGVVDDVGRAVDRGGVGAAGGHVGVRVVGDGRDRGSPGGEGARTELTTTSPILPGMP